MTKFRFFRPAVYAGLAVLIVTAAFFASAALRPKPRSKVPLPPSTITTVSVAVPSETPLAKATYTSKMVGDEPKYITLPSIKAEGFIEKMGVDQHGAVAAPNNVYLAGWYVNSVKPGQEGLSIIDGHVDGVHDPGIFLHLSQLAAGDTFQVELADGTLEQFKVKSVATVPEAAATDTLFARDNTIKHQLNLITCGGVFDRQSKEYLSRTIVVAEQL